MIKYELIEIEPGHYAKLLKCFNECPNEDNKSNTVIVIIPGNPGLIDFYEHMAIELNKQTKLPIVGISHTGQFFHENVTKWNSISLSDQINHKIKYLENNLLDDHDLANVIHQDRKLNLILIGHSIGCYVILEILGSIRKDIKSNIKKAILLFPTVERMAETPNGKVITFITKFLLWLVHFICLLITFIPNFLYHKLIDTFFIKRHQKYVTHLNDDLIDNASDVVKNMCRSYSCARSCFHMAKDEMLHVKSLKHDLVIEHSDLLLFYYGTTDKWCPIDFYYDMKNLIDGSNDNDNNNNNNTQLVQKLPKILLDEHGMEHSFVIFKKQTNILSCLIRDWIAQIDKN